MNTQYNPWDQALSIYELLHIGECEEIEFKSAKGGLPKEIWPTYSAFANTQGGVIVLGVKEDDEGLLLSGLTREEAEKCKDKFWSQVNNREVISDCLLGNDDVRVVRVADSFVLVIRVPQATRVQRPVYVKRIPDDGTYRRNDTGDFRCTAAEVRRMMADADLSRPADGRILKGFTWEDIDLPSLEQYRRLFMTVHPDHPWVTEDNDGLMRKLGGYRRDRESGEEGFTLAGLLMFGKFEAIKDPACAPNFFPDYKEITSDSDRWSDRIYPDGTWEVNLFQFYRRVLPKLQASLPTPFHLEDGVRRDGTLAHEALREAMANLCVHADYSEEASLLVTKYPDKIILSNPGVLLISRQQFFRGGESVCRNTSLQQMFMMMGQAEKAGSGVDKILRGWKASRWGSPYPNELLRPNKVELVMPLESLLDPRILTSLKDQLGSPIDELDENELLLLATAQSEGVINHERLKELLPMHPADITKVLQKLRRDGLLIVEGRGRGCVYHLNDGGKASEQMMQAAPSNDASSEAQMMQAAPSNNVSSEAQMMQAAPSNNASSEGQTMQATKRKFSAQETERLVCCFCTEWRTAQEIANYLHRTKDHVRNVILPRLLKTDALKQRFSSKRHPNQQYRVRREE